MFLCDFNVMKSLKNLEELEELNTQPISSRENKCKGETADLPCRKAPLPVALRLPGGQSVKDSYFHVIM